MPKPWAPAGKEVEFRRTAGGRPVGGDALDDLDQDVVLGRCREERRRVGRHGCPTGLTAVDRGDERHLLGPRVESDIDNTGTPPRRRSRSSRACRPPRRSARLLADDRNEPDGRHRHRRPGLLVRGIEVRAGRDQITDGTWQHASGQTSSQTGVERSLLRREHLARSGSVACTRYFKRKAVYPSDVSQSATSRPSWVQALMVHPPPGTTMMPNPLPVP